LETIIIPGSLSAGIYDLSVLVIDSDGNQIVSNTNLQVITFIKKACSSEQAFVNTFKTLFLLVSKIGLKPRTLVRKFNLIPLRKKLNGEITERLSYG